MDDRRAGWLIRRIRQHLRLRQIDVAAASGVSQQEISLIELGRLEQASLRTLRSVLGALGGTIEIQVRWRGGDLDRIADEGHALLVATTAEALRSAAGRSCRRSPIPSTASAARSTSLPGTPTRGRCWSSR